MAKNQEKATKTTINPVKLAEKSGFLGRKVLIYQKIHENHAKKPPFEGIVLADLGSRWIIKYQLTNGTWLQDRFLKAVCSSKPIDSSVDKSAFPTKAPKPKVQLRTRAITSRS